MIVKILEIALTDPIHFFGTIVLFGWITACLGFLISTIKQKKEKPEPK